MVRSSVRSPRTGLHEVSAVARSVDEILTDWRAAAAEIDEDDPDPEVAARIEALRAEHDQAIEVRRRDAEELRGAWPTNGGARR